MTFANLRAADWVAFIAALALLFVSAVDWYSTLAGDEARRIQGLSDPAGALGGEVEREVQEDARVAAEGAEKNAWQVSEAIDRVILLGLLLTSGLGIATAFGRAAGRASPLGVLTALAAAVTALMVVFRMLQEPGLDEATVVKAGAPLALVVLGIVALAQALSLRKEDADEARPAAV